jgi:hypothetical protein
MSRTFTDICEGLGCDGYAVVHGILSERDLEEIRSDYAERLDELAAGWRRKGYLTSLYENLPLEQRFLRLVREVKAHVPDWIQHFNIALPSNGIEEDSPIHLTRRTFALLTNSKILDLAESLLGPELSLNPIGLVRIKLPEAEVPVEQQSGLTAQAVWHQDRGVGLEEFNRTRFITVWVPITEANEENGCLRLIPGSNRGELISHCPGGVTSFDAGVVRIPDALLPGEPVSVPMRPGSVLLLDPLVVHSSYANRSDGIRWSFDFRLQRTGDPTGRPEWPAVVVRSAARPDSVASFEVWRDAWRAARTELAALRGASLRHRWDGRLTVCG